jgi:hypothetical protein
LLAWVLLLPTPVAVLQADNKAEPDPSSTPAVPAFFKKSRRLVGAGDAPAGEASGSESFLRLKTTSSHCYAIWQLCRSAGRRARTGSPRPPPA